MERVEILVPQAIYMMPQGGDCVMVKQHRLDPECGGEVTFSFLLSLYESDFNSIRWRRMRAVQPIEIALLLFQSARFSQDKNDLHCNFMIEVLICAIEAGGA